MQEIAGHVSRHIGPKNRKQFTTDDIVEAYGFSQEVIKDMMNAKYDEAQAALDEAQRLNDLGYLLSLVDKIVEAKDGTMVPVSFRDTESMYGPGWSIGHITALYPFGVETRSMRIYPNAHSRRDYGIIFYKDHNDGRHRSQVGLFAGLGFPLDELEKFKDWGFDWVVDGVLPEEVKGNFF